MAKYKCIQTCQHEGRLWAHGDILENPASEPHPGLFEYVKGSGDRAKAYVHPTAVPSSQTELFGDPESQIQRDLALVRKALAETEAERLTFQKDLEDAQAAVTLLTEENTGLRSELEALKSAAKQNPANPSVPK